MITVYIGVGTNIDRERHAQAAIRELEKLGRELKVSTIYECEAVGFEGQPFYNFVIELKTVLELTEFSQQLRKIELSWGRAVEAKKYQDRTLDLDILLFGDAISEQSPQLPRKDIYQYPFVTQPLYELCPSLVVPDSSQTIAQIWQQMDGFDSLKAIELDLSMS